MSEADPLAAADRRLEEVLESRGAHDPRGPCRTLLRELRERDDGEYGEALARWEEEVVGPLARGEGDPIERWLSFGIQLAQRVHPGRTVKIDVTGRAHPLEDSPAWDELLLHLPDEARTRAVAVSLPPEPSSAQQATVDLLVHGRLRLPDA